MNETYTPAEIVADLLIKVAHAKPGYRAQELGGAARAIGTFIQEGHLERADAYFDLHAAALSTGLDSEEIRRVVAWNWGGPHMVPAPRVRDLYPAVLAAPPDPVVDALVVGFQLPDDDDVLDRIVRRSEGEATGEYSTTLVCAAHGLDQLAEHLRSIDTREPAHRLSTVMWDEPYTNDGAVREHLEEIKGGLESALIYFKNGDKARMADYLADVVVGIASVASDLGLDLGEALARVVPVAKPA